VKTINFRDKSAIPKVIIRNRTKGPYTMAATIRSKSITRVKADTLQAIITLAIRDLGLGSAVAFKCDVKNKS
jgi:hypothetical protein